MSASGFHAQFHNPHGFAGRVAGAIMYYRSSNRQRARWAVELLEIRPSMRILEIGFGPGYALERMAKRCADCAIAGIDHSALMVRSATRRNRTVIEAGRMRLEHGSVESAAGLGLFDRILAINTAHAWKGRGESFERLRAVLRPGGRMVIVEQPRGNNATDSQAQRMADVLERDIRAAGFGEVSTAGLQIEPVTIAVIGVV